MQETETDNWRHWYDDIADENSNNAFKLMFTSYFYETALMYYNIIVDLSWTICYVSAEFTCAQKGKRVDFSGMKSVEDAVVLLRSAENNVTSPTAETNPFECLKSMNPDFTNAIDLIIEFWNKFAQLLSEVNIIFVSIRVNQLIQKLRSYVQEGLWDFLLRISQMVKRLNLLLIL